MRAAEGASHEQGGRHLSGAERLVPASEVESVSADLVRRALRGGVPPDFLRLTVERVPRNAVAGIPCLPVLTVDAADAAEACEAAAALLTRLGIPATTREAVFSGLRGGLGPSGSALRGAAIMDAVSAERLDPDLARGVRASHLDYASTARAELSVALEKAGLGHYRTAEALAVASKVIWSGVRAEVCWSDDPGYVAGYVASRELGYVRFPRFKPPGGAGGRVFLLDPRDQPVAECVRRLETCSTLVEGPIVVHRPVSVAVFLERLRNAWTN